MGRPYKNGARVRMRLEKGDCIQPECTQRISVLEHRVFDLECQNHTYRVANEALEKAAADAVKTVNAVVATTGQAIALLQQVAHGH